MTYDVPMYMISYMHLYALEVAELCALLLHSTIHHSHMQEVHDNIGGSDRLFVSYCSVNNFPVCCLGQKLQDPV